MRLVIDRFEGKYVVCESEDGQMLDVPAILLPRGVKEGDCLDVSISINEEETRKRRDEINKKTESIWK